MILSRNLKIGNLFPAVFVGDSQKFMLAKISHCVCGTTFGRNCFIPLLMETVYTNSCRNCPTLLLRTFCFIQNQIGIEYNDIVTNLVVQM